MQGDTVFRLFVGLALCLRGPRDAAVGISASAAKPVSEAVQIQRPSTLLPQPDAEGSASPLGSYKIALRSVLGCASRQLGSELV